MIVAFHTLGCKLNQYETESLAESFRNAQFTVTSEKQADLFVVNTCTVTSKSEQKARRLIRQLSRMNPEAVVIVTGCYAQLEEASLRQLAANVVVVPQDRKSILHALAERLSKPRHQRLSVEEAAALLGEIRENASQGSAPVTAARSPNNNHSLAEAGSSDPFGYTVDRFSFHSRAFLKIQDGCDCRCAYCRVPLARGPSVCLDPGRVLERVGKLESDGHPEVVLTGVNISSYRSGRGGRDPVALAELLEQLLAGTRTIRVRLSSLEPDRIGRRLLAVLGHERVCPHFHLPVQSGSDTILAAMRRRYRAEKVYDVVRGLRSAKPGAFIAADIIVGFPGETEQDFSLSRRLIEDLELARLHVFPFSPRPGTAAFELRPQIAQSIIKQRAHALLELSNVLSARYRQAWQGRIVQAVLEGGVSPEGTATGLSENYLHLQIHAIPTGYDETPRLASCRLEEPGQPLYKARFVSSLSPRPRYACRNC